MRNFIGTLAFSQGVPMISHGDELGRTQRGNNNAYCHDGPLTWVDWDLTVGARELLDFSRRAFAIRAASGVFRHARFLQPSDVRWYRPDGDEMSHADWADPSIHAFAMLLAPADPADVAALLALNGGGRARTFALPREDGGSWNAVLSSAPGPWPADSISQVTLPPHAFVLLRPARPPASPGEPVGD